MQKPTHQILYNYSLNLLSRYSKSSPQLKEKLHQKFPEADLETIEQVITKLQDTRILQDDTLAKAYAQSLANKGKSPFEIEIKLRQKKFPLQLIKTTINKLLPDLNLEETVTTLAEKKIRSLQKFPKPEQKQKLLAFLHRKAFPSAIINTVVKKLLS
ncbi:MAG: regulatory protein RecX [bacterium]